MGELIGTASLEKKGLAYRGNGPYTKNIEPEEIMEIPNAITKTVAEYNTFNKIRKTLPKSYSVKSELHQMWRRCIIAIRADKPTCIMRIN